MRPTQVRPVTAWALLATFAAILVAVALWELIGQPSAEPGEGPVAWVPRSAAEAWRSLRQDGLAAGNQALRRSLETYEDRLEEDSQVTEVVLPWAQTVLTGSLGVGNEKVLLGEEEWLFFRPDVEQVVGPPFLDEARLRRLRRAPDARGREPDPRIGLADLAGQLRERGIRLLVLPIPAKPTLEATRYAGVPVEGAVENPSWRDLLQWLEAAGIETLPVNDILRELTGTGEDPAYLATDTHWRPEAVAAVARELAARIQAAMGDELSSRRLSRGERKVEGEGDLYRLLRIPEARKAELFPAEEVTTRPVFTEDGRPWGPEASAPILLVGDSFTNVFSQPELGWGRGAGLAEQLAFALGAGVDRVAVNAGGALESRLRLAAGLRADPARYAATRLVVYQFAARELSFGDWRPVDLGLDRLAGVPAPAPARELGEAGLPVSEGGSPPTAGAPGPEASLSPAAGLPMPQEGVLVWESNRGGDWRIFRRSLAPDAPAKQLTPDEEGRQHCCPHLSPDGRGLIYLSRTVGKERYPRREVPGELRLMDLETGAVQVLSDARTYGWGNRAAVWRSDQEVIFVDGAGRTALLDLRSGARRLLLDAPREELGWLLDPTLSVATHAAPSFSAFDAAAGRVEERRVLGGCEPYFTADGRWGYWIAGAGGPLEKMELGSRRISTLLRKNDPRLGTSAGYLYFPMVSRDGRLLVYGASEGEHDHFSADYEIYALPLDGEGLEPRGTAQRLTRHPGTDRYPDVWLPPLELGLFAGEAPLEVRASVVGEVPPGAEVRWSDGAGGEAQGVSFRQIYRRPGSYALEARSGERRWRGQVDVRPAAPPRARSPRLDADGRSVIVPFDEAVRAEGVSARLDPGPQVTAVEVVGETTLRLRLAAPLEGATILRLDGVRDRGGVRAPPLRLPLEPAAWPVTREGLVFLWEGADAANAVPLPGGGEAEISLDPKGRARLDHDGSMILDAGYFEASSDAAGRVVERLKGSNELTLQAFITPFGTADGEDAEAFVPILALGSGSRKRNLVLGQRGQQLVLRLRTGETGPDGDRPEVDLFPLRSGEAAHLLLTYSPGRLAVYRDGEGVLETDAIQGDFFRWRARPLRFGAETVAGPRWWGRLAGVALHSRRLETGAAQAEAAAWRRLPGSPQPRRVEVAARLIARSRIPSLDEISPYRRALAVFEYEATAAAPGFAPGDRLRVAHWVILDGETLPAAARRLGEERRLVLEPFAAHPHLDSHFLSTTLGEPPGGTLYYDAARRIEP